MKKKQKINNEYVFRDKKFNTFKEMKTYAYFNMGVGAKEEGYELREDRIIKIYDLIKQERRLICIISYNEEDIIKELFGKSQLKLFTDG